MERPATSATSQSSILLVEDSLLEAELLRRTLAGGGYRVTIAHNGQEAMVAMRTHVPDLVMSDINMPVMNGYDLCRAIKQDPALAHVPVALLSVLSAPEDIIEAIDAGADSYMPKPYTEASLLGRLHSLLATPIRKMPAGPPLEVEYCGHRHVIASDPQQMLNLLLSVYENTLVQNRELLSIQAQLSLLNESLEEKVRERTEGLRKLSLAVEQSPVSIVITDLEGHIEYVNEAFTQVSGFRRDEVLGRNPRILQSGETPPEVHADLWRALTEGRVWHGEFINRRKDGACYTELATVLPIRQPDGSITHYLAVKEDVTEKKRTAAELDHYRHHLEELVAERTMELATARQAAEAANRAKSTFLANMSHELRSPLNAVIGFSEVLKDGLAGDLGATQREYITDIFDSGRHLLSLINDILDLSKVEAGRMVLDLETVSVDALLETSMSVVREKAASHRITLRQEVQRELPGIRLDARKTKQIIYNLLANAVVFTPEGGQVTLTVRRVARGALETWAAREPNGIRPPVVPREFTEFIEISVEDTGIGIRRADAPRLFQPFSQLDASLSRRYEGTGLGLAMVMKMAELHGGAVAVASELGRGSRFTVWLPWRAGSSDAVAANAPPLGATAADRRLALVVEDNDAAAELVRLQLETEAMEVLRVADAEAAIGLMGHQRPAVIVLDIFLPGMDGWDFLAQVKRPDSPWREVPIVITSIAGDTTKGFSLGAAQVLQKPVSRDELVGALHRLGLGSDDRPAYRILIVDDDPKAVGLLSAYLSRPDCSIMRAYGGHDGIETARRENPDVMILDLMMPEVSGFDVVEALRADPATATLPIIVVTAKELTAEDRQKLNGHVAAIVAKAGFDHGRFIAEVRRALAASDGHRPQP